jgi:hypothetical protein
VKALCSNCLAPLRSRAGVKLEKVTQIPETFVGVVEASRV